MFGSSRVAFWLPQGGTSNGLVNDDGVGEVEWQGIRLGINFCLGLRARGASDLQFLCFQA